MIDGFFSRPHLDGMGFGRRLGLRPIKPNKARIEYALRRGGIDRLDAIFVTHAHYDHAMDAPTVATLMKAHLIGSPSTRNVAYGEGFDKTLLHTVKPGATCRFGDFLVTMYKTPHGPTPLDIGGEITGPLEHPATVWDYKEGGNFSFHIEHPHGNILIIPSGKLEGGEFEGVAAEAVFLGVAQFTRRWDKLPGPRPDDEAQRYWDQAVVQPRARVVIPIHWDKLLRPLSQPLRPFRTPVDHFDRTMSWLTHLAGTLEPKGVRFILPQAFDRIDLAAEIGTPPSRLGTRAPAPDDKTCKPEMKSGGRAAGSARIDTAARTP